MGSSGLSLLWLSRLPLVVAIHRAAISRLRPTMVRTSLMGYPFRLDSLTVLDRLFRLWDGRNQATLLNQLAMLGLRWSGRHRWVIPTTSMSPFVTAPTTTLSAATTSFGSFGIRGCRNPGQGETWLRTCCPMIWKLPSIPPATPWSERGPSPNPPCPPSVFSTHPHPPSVSSGRTQFPNRSAQHSHHTALKILGGGSASTLRVRSRSGQAGDAQAQAGKVSIKVRQSSGKLRLWQAGGQAVGLSPAFQK